MVNIFFAHGEPKMIKYEKKALEESGLVLAGSIQALDAIAASGEHDVLVVDTSIHFKDCSMDLKAYNLLSGFAENETSRQYTLLSKTLWVHDQIRKKEPNQSVIVTGAHFTSAFESYLSARNTPVILSPYSPQQLVAVINELIE